MINLPNIGLRLLNWSLRRQKFQECQSIGEPKRITIDFAAGNLYETSTYKTPLG